MNLSEQQKLEFGIEIYSAVKAHLYGCTIEQGRAELMEGTSIETSVYSADEYATLSEKEREEADMVLGSRKRAVESQAMFVAEAALNFLDGLNKPVE